MGYINNALMLFAVFSSYMMLTVIVIKEQRHKPERKRHKCV